MASLVRSGLHHSKKTLLLAAGGAFGPPETLRASTTHAWWLIDLRGVCAVIFGLCALFLPILPLAWLIFLFGIYVMADGVLCLVASAAAAWRNYRYGVTTLAGISGLLIGASALLMPAPEPVMAVSLTLVWSSVTGLIFLGAAAQCASGCGRESAALAGIGCLLFAVVLWQAAPAEGQAVIRWLGCFALALGGMRLILASRLRACVLDIPQNTYNEGP